jgi:hypothetical protein
MLKKRKKNQKKKLSKKAKKENVDDTASVIQPQNLPLEASMLGDLESDDGGILEENERLYLEI